MASRELPRLKKWKIKNEIEADGFDVSMDEGQGDA